MLHAKSGRRSGPPVPYQELLGLGLCRGLPESPLPAWWREASGLSSTDSLIPCLSVYGSWLSLSDADNPSSHSQASWPGVSGQSEPSCVCDQSGAETEAVNFISEGSELHRSFTF